MERTSFRRFALVLDAMVGPGPSPTERKREHAGKSGSPRKNNYMKISDYTPGGVMEQVMITRTPPHYMPEIFGEFIFGISGNDYLFHYL